MFASLLVRESHPRAVYVLAWVYCATWGVLIPTYQPFTALLLALYTVSRRLGTRVSVTALVSSIPVWAMATVNTSTDSPEVDPLEVVLTALIWMVLVGLVWVAGRSGYRLEQNAHLRAAVERSQAQLERQEERIRLARDLHDTVSGSVSAITMQAAGARRALEADALQNVLQTIEQLGVDTLRELRTLLELLHAPQDASPLPSSARHKFADRGEVTRHTRACGVTVHEDQYGKPTHLTPAVDAAAFHILQEGYANVVRHAGIGATIHTHIEWNADMLAIAIRSTPGSSEPWTGQLPGSGFGLAGLQSRVTGLGGHLSSSQLHDGGFELVAKLPTQHEPDSSPPGDQPAPRQHPLLDGPSQKGHLLTTPASGEASAPCWRPTGDTTPRAFGCCWPTISPWFERASPCCCQPNQTFK